MALFPLVSLGSSREGAFSAATFPRGATPSSNAEGVFSSWVTPFVPDVPVNLLPFEDATFDSSVGTWVVNGNTTSLARSTTSPREGSGCLAVLAAGTGNSGIKTASGTSAIPVVAGQRYTFVVSAQGNKATAGLFMEVAFWTSGGSGLGSQNNAWGATIKSTGYSDYVFEVVAPATAAYAGLLLQHGDSPTATDWRIDRVGIFVGSVRSIRWEPPAGGTTAKNSSDTAAATDAVTVQTSGLTSADTATATDAVTLLDQGTVAKTDSDTATAADAVSAAARAATDTGTATDATSARASGSSDTGSATDAAGALVVAVSSSDTGAAAEALPAAAHTSLDAGTATEAVTAATRASSDTGAATDAGSLAAASTAAETASATDAVTARALPGADTAAGTEAVTARSTTSGDSGTATDAVSSLDLGSVDKVDSDTAAAIDAVIARGVRGADDAATLEAVIARGLFTLDTAYATDVVTVPPGQWVQMWDGSSWVGGTMYRWDGAAWV